MEALLMSVSSAPPIRSTHTLRFRTEYIAIIREGCAGGDLPTILVQLLDVGGDAEVSVVAHAEVHSTGVN